MRQKTSMKKKPVSTLYNEAMDQMEEEDYQEAAKTFTEIERQHPYSEWANKGMIMASYAYYKAKKYDDALMSVDRFLTLHPGDDTVPYMLYLRSMSLEMQMSDVYRDQEITFEAMDSWDELLHRFPLTPYATVAEQKIFIARERLAAKEMVIGRESI